MPNEKARRCYLRAYLLARDGTLPTTSPLVIRYGCFVHRQTQRTPSSSGLRTLQWVSLTHCIRSPSRMTYSGIQTKPGPKKTKAKRCFPSLSLWRRYSSCISTRISTTTPNAVRTKTSKSLTSIFHSIFHSFIVAPFQIRSCLSMYIL